MLTLGHISYSNCIPVHGRFLKCGPPPGVEIVHGVPSELNTKLANGEIHVAPASCIEFPRHPDRYRILPRLSISADGPVQTIQLVSRAPLEELRDGVRLALPTASATSVVLLKIIMEQQLGIRPDYYWFKQDSERGLEEGGGAALYIGDVAQREARLEGVRAYDLSTIWRKWTGLPFVFALWQIGAGRELDGELRELARAIADSRDWSVERLSELAAKYAGRYGWSPDSLLAYWKSLEFGWNERLAAGLDEFFGRAAELGEIPATRPLRYLEL